MNVYARYFDDEVLTTSLDELLNFIASIDGINLTPTLQSDIQEYVEGKYAYAKRFKVNSRSYFILIKTTAATLQEFKDNANRDNSSGREELEKEKQQFQRIINEEHKGWYMATVVFNRVVLTDAGKHQYISTEFKAKLKADSIQHCYDRVIRHLRMRSDVDPRSQYPSIKGRSFTAEYLGE